MKYLKKFENIDLEWDWEEYSDNILDYVTIYNEHHKTDKAYIIKLDNEDNMNKVIDYLYNKGYEDVNNQDGIFKYIIIWHDKKYNLINNPNDLNFCYKSYEIIKFDNKLLENFDFEEDWEEEDPSYIGDLVNKTISLKGESKENILKLIYFFNDNNIQWRDSGPVGSNYWNGYSYINNKNLIIIKNQKEGYNNKYCLVFSSDIPQLKISDIIR